MYGKVSRQQGPEFRACQVKDAKSVDAWCRNPKQLRRGIKRPSKLCKLRDSRGHFSFPFKGWSLRKQQGRWEVEILKSIHSRSPSIIKYGRQTTDVGGDGILYTPLLTPTLNDWNPVQGFFYSCDSSARPQANLESTVCILFVTAKDAVLEQVWIAQLGIW